MAKQFTDDDLRVHLKWQEDWVQAFVDEHGKEKHHPGQAKLLFNNLLGLVLVEEDMKKEKDGRSIQLVVAGASPDTHMLVLLRHLRRWRVDRGLQIHLFDPQALDKKLQSIVDNQVNNISFYPRKFTDKDDKDWSDNANCVVFFSDIRGKIHADKRLHTHEDEVQIEGDMQRQEAWVQTMQPDYCMLKFHAPHATEDGEDESSVPESVSYLHGDVYEQAYAGLFSAEQRLFCKKEDISGHRDRYQTKHIERLAFYHTYHTRPSTFSVDGTHKTYDDAFAAHVAHKAARWLRIDAQQLLHDAHTQLHASPLHFSWPAPETSRMQALHRRVRQIL
jgi:hypothetical protein